MDIVSEVLTLQLEVMRSHPDSRLDDLQKILDENLGQMDILKQNLADKDEEISDLKSKVEKERQSHFKTHCRNTELESQCNTFSEQIENLQTMYNDLKEELDALKNGNLESEVPPPPQPEPEEIWLLLKVNGWL